MTPTYKSILVSVTEGCHVGCAHCGFIGSKRDRETDPGELKDWVLQACDYGIPAIIFTGGEPFERFDVLREGVLAAASHSVPTSCFTSSYWATSVEESVSMLRELRGLRQLYLSTDVYHQRRVPYDNVHNAIAAADELEIPEITLCITYANEKDRLTVRENYERYGDRVRFHESRVIPTPFIKRALKESDSMPEVSEENFEPTCWLDTPLINPNGDVSACHTGKVGAHSKLEDLPYWLGSLRRQSFQAVMESARWNVEYQYLRTHGPRGIARLFNEFPSLAAEVGRTNFSGPCDLCFSALFTEAGRKCLSDYANRPEVLAQINVHLALRFGEPPLEFDRVGDDEGNR